MIILITTAFIFLFGGSGLEFYLTNLKDSVKDAVPDKPRQEVILDTSKALAKDLESLQKDVEKQFKAYAEVHGNYEATPADFDAVTARMVSDQQQLSKLVLDARDKMHEQITADEWRAVFSKQ
jgi:hypothetical protein